jgi:hypothetical protein
MTNENTSALLNYRNMSFTDQRRLEKLVNVEGMIPSLRDPERFSFWVITITFVT